MVTRIGFGYARWTCSTDFILDGGLFTGSFLALAWGGFLRLGGLLLLLTVGDILAETASSCWRAGIGSEEGMVFDVGYKVPKGMWRRVEDMYRGGHYIWTGNEMW